jgi:hypothetical protein
MKFNQEELEEMLRGAEDYQGVRYNLETGVAFAPRDTIHLGEERDWNEFAKNGLNIAIFSPEGAENLAQLGKNNFKRGYTWEFLIIKTLKHVSRLWAGTATTGWMLVASGAATVVVVLLGYALPRKTSKVLLACKN